MSVATLRAQFGLLPAGDPYGNPSLIAPPSFMQGGLYSTIAAKYKPDRPNPLSLIFTSPEIFLTSVAKILQARCVTNGPAGAGAQGICPASATPLSGLSLFGGSQGTPFASVGAISSAVNPIVGTAFGAAAGILSAFFTNQCAAPVAQFGQVWQQIGSVLNQVMVFLDNNVGAGKITPGQAKQVWDTYVNQVLSILQSARGQCFPFIPFYLGMIGAITDFSENVLWPDLYPKTITVNPGQPVISTPTPAPASEFAATPAAPPASFAPSIQTPPNSLPGSPRLGSVILPADSGYGPTTPFSNAQPLPQGVDQLVIAGGQLVTPMLIIAAVVILALVL